MTAENIPIQIVYEVAQNSPTVEAISEIDIFEMSAGNAGNTNAFKRAVIECKLTRACAWLFRSIITRQQPVLEVIDGFSLNFYTKFREVSELKQSVAGFSQFEIKWNQP